MAPTPAGINRPPGTLADVAPEADLKRDGIELPKDLPKTAAARRAAPNDAWRDVPPAKTPLLAKGDVTARIKIQ